MSKSFLSLILLVAMNCISQSWDYLGNRNYTLPILNSVKVGDTIVAVGTPGLILTGTSLDSLQNFMPPVKGQPKEIAHLGNVYVVSLDSCAILRSVNGVVWERIPIAQSLRQLRTAGEYFVGTTFSSGVVYSKDGKTWKYAMPASRDVDEYGLIVSRVPALNAMYYSGSTFYSYGLSIIWKTSDFVKWTEDTIAYTGTAPKYPTFFNNIVMFNGKIYAAESDEIFSSTDGKTFTSQTNSLFVNLGDIYLYNSTLILSRYSAGGIAPNLISTDGVNWSEATQTIRTNLLGIYNSDWVQPTSIIPSFTFMEEKNGFLYGYGQKGLYKGSNVNNWETLFSDSAYDWNSDGPSQIILGAGTKIYRSSDGVSWKEFQHCASSHLKHVEWSGNFYYAWNETEICKSSTGETWIALSTPASALTTSRYISIIWRNNQFYATNLEPIIYTSADGITWSNIRPTQVDGVSQFKDIVTFKDSTVIQAMACNIGGCRSNLIFTTNQNFSDGQAFSAFGTENILSTGDSLYLQNRYSSTQPYIYSSGDGYKWNEYPARLTGPVYSFVRFKGELYASLGGGIIAQWKPVSQSVSVLIQKKQTEVPSFKARRIGGRMEYAAPVSTNGFDRIYDILGKRIVPKE